MPEQRRTGGFWRKLRHLFRRPTRFSAQDFYEAGFQWATDAPVTNPDGIPFDVKGVRQVGLESLGETLVARVANGENVRVPPAEESAEAYCNGFRDGLERRANSVQ